MRGALYRVAANESWFRIIPADAGSTFSLDKKQPLHEDHPRGCGEHSGLLRVAIRLSGSSPRMRGAPRHLQTGDHPGGIIPADAGSTTSCFAPLTFDQDHPRGCGEHYYAFASDAFGSGSSPRMRGARVSQLLVIHA